MIRNRLPNASEKEDSSNLSGKFNICHQWKLVKNIFTNSLEAKTESFFRFINAQLCPSQMHF